jgi:hypothetical protein
MASFLIHFFISLWITSGVILTMNFDSDLGYGPIRRFLLTPTMVFIMPAIEIAFYFYEKR